MIHLAIRLVLDYYDGRFLVDFIITSQEKVRLDEAKRLSRLVKVTLDDFIVIVYCLQAEGIGVFLFLFVQVSCWLASTTFALLILVYSSLSLSHRTRRALLGLTVNNRVFSLEEHVDLGSKPVIVRQLQLARSSLELIFFRLKRAQGVDPVVFKRLLSRPEDHNVAPVNHSKGMFRVFR